MRKTILSLITCFNCIDHNQHDQTFTCGICLESDILPNFKFNNKNDKRCRRRHPFCTDCMIKYIQVKLEENVSHIKCPAMTCKRFLKPLSCRPKITPQVFEKWCDVLSESSLLGVDKVYCPNIECRELILNECDDIVMTRCVCPYCKEPYCFPCKVPWHDDGRSTCVKVEDDQNNIAFERLSKEKRWQRCPVCRHCVELYDGCNLVTCRCRTRFCYWCGKQECANMACPGS